MVICPYAKSEEILELLKKDTSEGAIVEAMCARYDAPEGVIAAEGTPEEIMQGQSEELSAFMGDLDQ